MAVTQKQIAARLGVSQTLVGVALSGKGRIGAELKAQILDEANRLGYKPNHVARALKSGRSHLVALWMPRPLGDFDTQILEALHEMATQDGFHLLTALGARFGEVTDDALLELPLNEWPLDGVLALDSSPRMSAAIRLLSQKRPDLPLISFGHRALFDEPTWDAIGLDLYQAAEQAVRHLVERGCRELVFIAAESLFGDEEPRLRAFRAVCKELSVQTHEIVVPDCHTLRHTAQQHFEVYLRSRNANSASLGVMAGNDDVALGVLRGLRRADVAVPTQTRVIGCDDIQDAADADPPLSTIALPLKPIVEAAWAQFKQRLAAAESAPRQQTLSAELILRKSA